MRVRVCVGVCVCVCVLPTCLRCRFYIRACVVGWLVPALAVGYGSWADKDWDGFLNRKEAQTLNSLSNPDMDITPALWNALAQQ